MAAVPQQQGFPKAIDRHQLPLILSLSKDACWGGSWFDRLTMSG